MDTEVFHYRKIFNDATTLFSLYSSYMCAYTENPKQYQSK